MFHYYNKISILFVLLVCYPINAGIIIPDPAFPIVLNKPNSDMGGQSIIFRFSLPENSNGLSYGQFIGVEFKKEKFDEQLAPGNNHSCKLASLTGTSYFISPAKDNESLSKLYCRIDSVSDKLLAGGQYVLTITFTNQIQFVSNQLVKNVSLFTATTNFRDKIILDSNPTFGDFALYPSPLSVYYKEFFTIESVDQNPASAEVYSPFSVTVSLRMSMNFFPKIMFIVTKFPVSFNFDTAVVTSTDSAVKGTFTLTKFSSDGSYIISGITDEIIPIGFSFKFQIINIRATALDPDRSLTTNRSLFEVFFYYQNSLSIISYSSKDSLKVVPISLITLTANHPESWDYYSGSAWPMKFSISLKQVIPVESYMVLQHVNGKTSENSMHFIANTCDFSKNLNLSQEIGVRPVCFPLRNDLYYPGSGGSAVYSGSAIVFKIPPKTDMTNFILSVFLFPDMCGTSTLVIPQNPSDYNYVQFSFKLTVYKSIDVSKLEENRFQSNDIIAAMTSSVAMSNKCYNSYFSSASNFNNADYTHLPENDSIMFRDITTFNYGYTDNNHASQNPSSFLNGMMMTNFQSGSLLQQSEYGNLFLKKGSYFTLKYDFSTTASLTLPRNFIASSVSVQSKNTTSRYPGVLQARFSSLSNYLTQGDSNCYMSWGLQCKNNPAVYLTNQNKLLNSANSGSLPSTGSTRPNILIQQDAANTFDSSKTSFNAGNMILSSKYSNNNGADFQFLSDDSTAPAVGSLCSFAYYTNCFKFNSSLDKKIKSVYDYIEFDLYFLTGPQAGPFNVNRFNRFFKFVSTLGLYDNPSMGSYIAGEADIKFHSVYFPITPTVSFNNNQVCLISVSYSVLDNSYSQEYPILSIYVGMMNLIIMDYSDVSSTYPIPNNISYPFPSNVLSMRYDKLANIGDLYKSSTYSYPNGSYYQFLANSILIVNYQVSTEKDLLIPVFCPVSVPAKPYVTIQWINSNNSHIVSGIGKTLVRQSNNWSFFSPGDNSLTETYPGIYTALRFRNYTSNDNNSLLVIPNPSRPDSSLQKTYSTNYRCSGYLLFLNPKIFLNPEIPPGIVTAAGTGLGLSAQSSKGFYIRGKLFNAAILVNTSNPVLLPTDNNGSNSVYFTGVRRPSLSRFAEKNVNSNIPYNFFPTLDLFAFFCFSSLNDSSSDQNYFTNYTEELSDGTTGYFLLDWDPQLDQSVWETPKAGADKQLEPIYKGDPAGNVRFNIKIPSGYALPQGVMIKIISDRLKLYTSCGIAYNSDLNTLPCTITSTSEQIFAECSAPIERRATTICCYGVDTGVDTFVFPTVTVYLNTRDPKLSLTQVEINRHIFSELLTLTTLSKFDWVTKNSQGTDLITNASGTAYLSSLTYLDTLQEGAYAKACLTISLPREIVRGATIILNGDLSSLAIPNFSPKMKCTFGGDSAGDILLDGCLLSLSVGNLITITTKNLVYKCGMTLSKEVKVYIWPIQVVKYAKPSLAPSFTVQMLLQSNSIQLSNPASSTTLEYLGTDLLSTKPFFGGPSLFTLTDGIVPRTLGEIADYIFTIDIRSRYLDLVKSTWSKVDIIINEVMIIFPFIFAQQLSTVNMLKCSYLIKETANPVICNVTDDNVLMVSLISSLGDNLQYNYTIPITESPENNIKIQVTGIVNSELGETNKFLVAMNYLNTTGVRTQYVVGQGYAPMSLTEPKNSGKLMITSLNSNNTFPREIATITLNATYDYAYSFLGTSSMTRYQVHVPEYGKNIDNNPIFIITLPPDYYVASSIFSATVSEYYYDSSNVLTKLEYPIKSSSYVSNTVRIFLSANNIQLKENFSHWGFSLKGIYNPLSPVQSTGRFRLTLTNSINSVVFRTYSNLNAINNGVVLATPYDELLIYGRGLSYAFDVSKKYAIDITTLRSRKANYMIIKRGRFVSYTFTLYGIDQPVDLTRSPKSTEISLKDNIFQTDALKYKFDTSIGFKDFYIGAPCTIPAGSYLLYFILSNTEDFNTFAPIKVFIDTTPGTVDTNGPNGNIFELIKGGKQRFSLILSEPTFDKLEVSFSQLDGYKNDATAVISTFVFERMVQSTRNDFSITSMTAFGYQKFTPALSNKCFTMVYSTYSFIVSAENQDIPYNYSSLLPKLFTYYNGDTDSKIKKNSIKFTFSPDIAPLFLYCALICYSSPFPSDDIIYTNSTISNPINYPYDTTLAYYSSYIPVSIGDYDLVFENLVRGMQYKLRCLVNTTLTNSYKTAATSIATYPPPNGGTWIKTSNISPTVCSTFEFLVDPGVNVTTELLNYCQSMFRRYSGCTVCIDGDSKSVQGMGLTASDKVTCKSATQPTIVTNSTSNTTTVTNSTTTNSTTTNTTLKRHLQQFYRDYDFSTPTSHYQYSFILNTGISQFSYTLCAVQDKLCPEDLPITNQAKNAMVDMLLTFKDTENFYRLLKLNSTMIYLTSGGIKQDFFPPNVKDLKKNIVNTPEFPKAGNYSVSIRSPDSDIFCYYKITDSNVPPSISEITSCTDISRCGNAKIFREVTVFKANMPVRFSINVFNMWTVCYNNLPNAQQPSEVFSLVSFAIGPD